MLAESASMTRLPKHFDLIATKVCFIGKNVIEYADGTIGDQLFHGRQVPLISALPLSLYRNGAPSPGFAALTRAETSVARMKSTFRLYPFCLWQKRAGEDLGSGQRWLGRYRHGRPPVRGTTCKA